MKIDRVVKMSLTGQVVRDGNSFLVTRFATVATVAEFQFMGVIRVKGEPDDFSETFIESGAWGYFATEYVDPVEIYQYITDEAISRVVEIVRGEAYLADLEAKEEKLARQRENQ